MIEIFESYDKLSRKAAEWIYDKGKEYIAERDEFLLALAGGGTPRQAYRILAEISKDDKEFWEKVRVYWTDERYVPHSSEASNYRSARKTLLDFVPIPPANIHPIPTDYEDANESANEYSEIFPACADVIMLGMGQDGHIASIFPYGNAVCETKKRFTIDYAPVEPRLRITATFGTIRSANEIIVLVAGESKRQALKKVFDETGSIEEIPARAVKDALWFTDESAAMFMKRSN